MSKHTPGPWEWDGTVWQYDDQQGAPWLVQSPYQDIKSKAVLSGVIRCNTEADARLIAAAPDHHAVALELDRLMLVIESAVRQHDPSHSEAVVAMLKANRATIAKATGEHHE